MFEQKRLSIIQYTFDPCKMCSPHSEHTNSEGLDTREVSLCPVGVSADEHLGSVEVLSASSADTDRFMPSTFEETSNIHEISSTALDMSK